MDLSVAAQSMICNISVEAILSNLMTLLTELVQLDSINPNLVPGGAGEGKIAQHTSNWARG